MIRVVATIDLLPGVRDEFLMARAAARAGDVEGAISHLEIAYRARGARALPDPRKVSDFASLSDDERFKKVARQSVRH